MSTTWCATAPERGSHALRRSLRLAVVVLGVLAACWLGARFAHAASGATDGTDASVLGTTAGQILPTGAASSSGTPTADAAHVVAGTVRSATAVPAATDHASTTSALPAAGALPVHDSSTDTAADGLAPVADAVTTPSAAGQATGRLLTGPLPADLAGTARTVADLVEAPLAATAGRSVGIAPEHQGAGADGRAVAPVPARDAGLVPTADTTRSPSSTSPRSDDRRRSGDRRLVGGGTPPAAPGAPGNGGPMLDGASAASGSGGHGRRLVADGPTGAWQPSLGRLGTAHEVHGVGALWLAARSSRPD